MDPSLSTHTDKSIEDLARKRKGLNKTYNALSSGEVVEVELNVDVGVDVRHLDVDVLSGHLLGLDLGR